MPIQHRNFTTFLDSLQWKSFSTVCVSVKNALHKQSINTSTVGNKTGSANWCPERVPTQLHMRHLANLCIHMCQRFSDLQYNNANPFHDSRGDSNRENRPAVMWDGCRWVRSLLCNWCCYCSLSQCVKAGIARAGTLSISQTSVFREKPRDPPYLLQPHWACRSNNWPAASSLPIRLPLIGRLTLWSPPKGYEPECNGGLIS